MRDRSVHLSKYRIAVPNWNRAEMRIPSVPPELRLIIMQSTSGMGRAVRRAKTGAVEPSRDFVGDRRSR